MNNKDELSLADIYLSFRNFGRYALQKWWIALIILVVVMSGAILWWNSQPETYSTKLTYIVEGGGGGGSAVLAQLGIGGGGDGPNIDRIEEVAKSNLVGLSILNDTIVVNGQADLFGNHMIRYSGLRKMWLENGMAEEDMLYLPGEESSLSREQLALRKRLLSNLYYKGEVGPMVVIETDPLTTIATVTTTSQNEEITVALANLQFDQLQHFYFEKTQARQLDNINVTKNLADSLLQRITVLQGSISRMNDRGANIVLNDSKRRLLQLQQEEQRTQVAYAEAYKSLQLAKFNLRTSRPNIEVIDRPFLPLYPQKYALSQLLLIAVLVSTVLALGLLFLLFLRHNILEQLTTEHGGAE